MNIVVCVKYVPDATADRHFESDNTVDRVGVPGLLSELDEYAVEQALQLKEKNDGDEVEVTALTVGPEDAAEAIKKALQMGADKGVHVVDDAIAGSDALATSQVLAAAIEKIGDVDVVMCGMSSTDATAVRRPGDAGRAPRPAAGHAGLGDREPGQGVPDQARRRHLHRGDRRDRSAGAVGDRPVRRGALPVLQGHHGREEEAAGHLVARPTSASTPARSGSTPRGPRSRTPRSARRAPQGEIVTDEDGSGATALVEFLASKKFI